MNRSSLIAYLLVALASTDFVSSFVPVARRQVSRPLFVQPPITDEKTTAPAANNNKLQNQQEMRPNDTQVVEEEKNDSNNLMSKIKDAGVAGAISLGIWEGAFWCFSIPVALIGYQQVTGHWPSLSDKDDMAKLGAEAFAFVNFARFAVPLRVGLALSTTPWVQANIVDKFGKKEEDSVELERPEDRMVTSTDFESSRD